MLKHNESIKKKIRVIRPEWLTACVRKGKIVSTDKYCLSNIPGN